MKILVFAENVKIDDKLIDKSDVMVTVNPDKKGFEINRHVALSNTRLFMKHLGYKRHMSELKHILLAERNKE